MLKKVVILIWSVLAMLMMLTSMVTATVWLVGHETMMLVVPVALAAIVHVTILFPLVNVMIEVVRYYRHNSGARGCGNRSLGRGDGDCVGDVDDTVGGEHVD